MYHLPNVSGKSGWKVTEIRLFGLFSRKFPETTKGLKRWSCFLRTEYSNRKFVFHLFKAIFDTDFRPSRSFFGKWNWFIQMVNAIPGRNLPVLNFTYLLPRRWTNRFTNVDGNQLLCHSIQFGQVIQKERGWKIRMYFHTHFIMKFTEYSGHRKQPPFSQIDL